MVSRRKTTPHKRAGTKSSNPSPETLLKTVRHKRGVSSLRQHKCSDSYKQTGWDPLTRALCPHVATSNMVQQTPDITQSKTCPRITQCYCGRSVQEEPNTTYRVVSIPSDLQTDHTTLATPANRPIRYQSKQETSNLSLTHTRSPSMGSGRTKYLLEEHDQSCRLILIAPKTKPWFWDLVELSLGHPRQLPPIRSLLKQPLNNQFHTHPESLNLHAWYLGVQSSRTRASLQKWQIKLLHFKDSLLEPSMHQNGQFSNNGASKNR